MKIFGCDSGWNYFSIFVTFDLFNFWSEFLRKNSLIDLEKNVFVPSKFWTLSNWILEKSGLRQKSPWEEFFQILFWNIYGFWQSDQIWRFCMLHSEITQIWTHQMPKLTKKGVVGLIWENIPRVLFTAGLIFISHPHSKTHFLENSQNPTKISKQWEIYKTSWPPRAYQNQSRTEISNNFQITALKSPQLRGQQINLRDFPKKSDF